MAKAPTKTEYKEIIKLYLLGASADKIAEMTNHVFDSNDIAHMVTLADRYATTAFWELYGEVRDELVANGTPSGVLKLVPQDPEA